MNRTLQPKTQPRSCESYIKTINELRSKLTTTQTVLDHAQQMHDNEAKFLRWTVLIALGVGFVIGVIFSKGLTL